MKTCYPIIRFKITMEKRVLWFSTRNFVSQHHIVFSSSIKKVSLKFYVLHCCIFMSMYFVVDFLTGHYRRLTPWVNEFYALREREI